MSGGFQALAILSQAAERALTPYHQSTASSQTSNSIDLGPEPAEDTWITNSLDIDHYYAQPFVNDVPVRREPRQSTRVNASAQHQHQYSASGSSSHIVSPLVDLQLPDTPNLPSLEPSLSGPPVLMPQHPPSGVELPDHATDMDLDEFPLDGNDDTASVKTESTLERTLKSLAPRGKGQYTCPYGHNCTKGGVSDDGSIVVFERNSAYK